MPTFVRDCVFAAHKVTEQYLLRTTAAQIAFQALTVNLTLVTCTLAAAQLMLMAQFGFPQRRMARARAIRSSVRQQQETIYLAIGMVLRAETLATYANLIQAPRLKDLENANS